MHVFGCMEKKKCHQNDWCKKYTEVYQLDFHIKYGGTFSNAKRDTKKMMKKHGLKLEILRGPTQSGVCSVKNWYIYIYKGSFVKPKHYTY